MYRLEWNSTLRPPRLVLDGDIDLAAQWAVVSSGLRAAPPQGGALVVDLTRVTSFDGSGARALLELRSALARRGTKLQLANMPPCVACTFESIGVPTMVRSSHQLN